MGCAILDMKCGCHISRGFCQAARLSRRKGVAACRARGEAGSRPGANPYRCKLVAAVVATSAGMFDLSECFVD